MLGMYQTGLLNSAGLPIVLPATFFFGGLVQIIVDGPVPAREVAGDVRVKGLPASGPGVAPPPGPVNRSAPTRAFGGLGNSR